MNSKKLLMLVIITLVIGTLAFNWYAGNEAEEELAKTIVTELAKDDTEIDLEYASIAVNPLLAEVTLQEVIDFIGRKLDGLAL